MKLLLSLGIIIIFISVFFIFFTANTSIRVYAKCLAENWPYPTACQSASWPFLTGLVMIGVFVVLDASVAYIIFSHIRPSQNTMLLLERIFL